MTNDEGKKTILLTVPVTIWREIKNKSHLEQISLSAWVRNLINKELLRNNK